MNRITWVDNLRGLSILAIIFLHSTIAVHNNAGHFTLISNTMNEMLAPVRLGLMFFVSGLFVDVGLKCQQRVKSDPLTVTTNGLILIHLVYSGLASAITPAFRFCFSR